MNIICKYCQAENSIIEENTTGEVVCTKCGYIYADYIISDEYEKRTFEGDEDQIKRVGPAENPEQETEPGTTLIVRQNGKTKIVKTYSKQTKINKK